VVDNLDKTKDRYIEKFGEEVYVFDKNEVASRVDRGDNRGGLGTAMFARNACFDIARDLGLKHFVQLDDDYTNFQYRYDANLDYTTIKVNDLDGIFSAFINFMETTPTDSIAMTQGGDFIGGSGNKMWASGVTLRRKCMNSWFCRTDRPFDFSMRMNDDVTTYVLHGIRGRLFFTQNQISLVQPVTQSVPGGMSDLYAESGTYMKTFYTVMAAPSCVKVGILRGQSGSRIHHSVNWNATVPVILREKWRKQA
jgi:hypothetical protein